VSEELTPEQIAAMGAGGLIAYVQRLVDGHSPQFGVNRQTGEVYQQVCECGNPACIRCVLAAYRSVMIAGYNAKVQDFAAETLARSAAEAQVAHYREALELIATYPNSTLTYPEPHKIALAALSLPPTPEAD
jgi:hypothetical protein